MEKKGKFILFTVAEFDAWLMKAKFSRTIRLIQNHHTLVPCYQDFTGQNHFSLLAGMERYHMVERGFAEIAQNLTTFPDGKVALCRSLEKIPAGIKGANQGGVCIEHLGNFDAGKDTMADAHRDTICKVNALLCREFGVTPSIDTIVYHHWYDLDSGIRTNGTGHTKSCPGMGFFGGNSLQMAKRNFITLVERDLENSAASPISSPLRTAEVNASSLNVRTAPAASAARVKTLGRGVLVQVYAEQNAWCRIHPTDQQWVSARYLS